MMRVDRIMLYDEPMTVEHPPPDDLWPALWPFACALYGAPGVSEAVIMLQDRHSVDVNMMLFLCWRAGRDGGLIPEADLATAIAASAPLQVDTIRPLRARRRAIPRDGTRQAERQRLLDMELAAEKAELDLLEGLWHTDRPRVEDRAAIREVAMANLTTYFAHSGITMPDETMARLTHIARAAADIHLKGEKEG